MTSKERAEKLRLPWATDETASRSPYIKNRDGVAVLWGADIPYGMNKWLVLVAVVEGVNLLQRTPAADVEEVRDRNAKYRTELRADWKGDEVHRACYQSILDVETLLKAVDERDKVIDDLLKDCGSVDADAAPGEEARREAERYRKVLEELREIMSRTPARSFGSVYRSIDEILSRGKS